jgi:hypothetical protein
MAEELADAHSCERPLVAKSGHSFRQFFQILYVRFGSVAAVPINSNPMAALGRIADVRPG